MEHGLASLGPLLIVFAQPSVAPQPTEGAFDAPTPRLHDKAVLGVTPLDDLQAQGLPRQRRLAPLFRLSGVGPDGYKQFQLRQSPTDSLQ